MNFLGLYREPAYSPGRHAANDAVILRLAAKVLERQGVRVRLATLEEARLIRREFDLIFSMCQGPLAITELREWKREGLRIVNDPEASRRTYRDTLCSALREKDLGFPHSFFVSTAPQTDLDGCRSLFDAHGAWLKRGDVHATGPGDVVRLMHFSELRPALDKFHARGLSTAVVQQHREGDEVKFYAVRGGGLFWPFYPRECEGHPFDEKQLERLAERAAGALDLSIYGGDAIISPEGRITLIDLNDWPSFAPCRGAAASAIARYLKDYAHALQGKKEIFAH